LPDSLNSVTHLSVSRSLTGEALRWFAWLTVIFLLVPAVTVFLPGLALLSLGVVVVSIWMMHRLVSVFDLR